MNSTIRAGVTVTSTVLGDDTDALWVAPPNTTVVRLTISNTVLSDAGNYTCAPENMVHDNIRLSISRGGCDLNYSKVILDNSPFLGQQ